MNLIVLVDQNWGIGREGEQLLYLKPDLKRFAQLTSGHSIILGRKTLATFPNGRPLPKRRNLILSKNQHLDILDGELFHNLEDLLHAAPNDSFVVGGESIYRQLLPYCTCAYVTKVATACPADTYFPNLDHDPSWQVQEQEGPFEEDGLQYRYLRYQKV